MENEIQKEIRCPLCAGASHFFCTKNGYRLYTCEKCALKFVSPLPMHTAEVYGEDYFAGAHEGFGYVNYDADKEPMRAVFEEYMRRIEKYSPKKGALLDVGAATGFFLDIAKQYGFEPYGVEISPYAAEVGRSKGLPMITGALSDVPAAPKFSVVTMFDVIEHVEEPKAELERVRDLSLPKGLLVINTPDAGSLFARALGKRWHAIVPPEHLYFFNRANLSKLLEQSGFEVLEATSIGKSFTLSYIFKTLYAWQGFAVWKWLSEFCQMGILKSLNIPLNLRDNMFLVARKL